MEQNKTAKVEQKNSPKMAQAEESLKEILERLKPFLPPKQAATPPVPQRWTASDRAIRQYAPRRPCTKDS